MKNTMNYQDIVILLPSFNEEKYISSVLQKLKKNWKYKIVVVDDGSRDHTATLAKAHTPYVLTHAINLGKGAAMTTGCEYAFTKLKAKAVILMDSDDQHDSSEISLFVTKILEGSQLVLGVRHYDKHMPKIKAYANKFSSYVVKMLFGKYIPDIPSGYKAMTKEVYLKIHWDAQKYDAELEMAIRIIKQHIEFSVVPIKTIYNDLQRGMTFLDVLSMLTQIMIWRITI